MTKEKVTLDVAGTKMTVLTQSPQTVLNMSYALDKNVSDKLKITGGKKELAFLMVALEQSENLRKNAEVIKNQQKQIFELNNLIASLKREKSGEEEINE